MLQQLLAKAPTLRTTTRVQRHRCSSALLNSDISCRNSAAKNKSNRGYTHKYKHAVVSTLQDLSFAHNSRMASFSTLSTDITTGQAVDTAQEFKTLWLHGKAPEPLLKLMMGLNSSSESRKNRQLANFIQTHLCPIVLVNDKLDMVRLVLSIIDLVRESEGRKKKNSKIECIMGLLDGLKKGGIIVSDFKDNDSQEVQEIVDTIIEAANQRFLSPSRNGAEDMLTMYTGGVDLSTIYVDLDIYIKLVCQMTQNITPGLRCILNDVPSVIPLLEELKYKQLWKPWARLYSIFSAQLAPHMPHVKVLSQLFEVEQYELCSEMLSYHVPPILTSEAFREVAVSITELMLASEKTDVLAMAEQISTRYQLHAQRTRATFLKKRSKLRTMCRNGKWRIAVEIASSPDHKIDIFHSLKQLCKYQQAQLAYDQMNLAALGIAPVSEEEFLHEKSLDLYVRFPFDKEKESVIIVDSAGSTQQAIAAVLGSLKPTNFESEHIFDGFVGVDAEWQASILGQRNTQYSAYSQRVNRVYHEGASILQLATPAKVIIVDFVALKSIKGRHKYQTMSKVSELLQLVFCNQRILKVGWGFESSDRGMLEATCNGLFREIFRQSKSIVSMDRVVAGLFGKFREDREQERRKRARESQPESDDSMVGSKLTSEQIDVIISTTKKNPASLSKVCNLFLGKELDKTEQVSTWNTRPLSTSQIMYASLDAHIPLAVLSSVLDAPPEDLAYVKSLYPFPSSSVAHVMSTLSLDQVLALGSSKEKRAPNLPPQDTSSTTSRNDQGDRLERSGVNRSKNHTGRRRDRGGSKGRY